MKTFHDKCIMKNAGGDPGMKTGEVDVHSWNSTLRTVKRDGFTFWIVQAEADKANKWSCLEIVQPRCYCSFHHLLHYK